MGPSLLSPVLLASVLLAMVGGCAGSRADDRPWLGRSLALSPDDATVVFPYHVDGSASLYRADLSGQNVRLLASPGRRGHFLDPAFSPDGALVAFVAHAGDDFGHGALRVVPASGGASREIETGVRIVTEAAFSRDGRRIYFLGADGYRRTRGPAGSYPVDIDLYVVGVDGGGLRRLTTFVTPSMGGLAVVPGEAGEPERVFLALGVVELDDDGAYVDLGPSHYVVFDPEHPGERTPVWPPAEAGPWAFHASISPDGQRVAYADRDDLEGLFVLDRASPSARPAHPVPSDSLRSVSAIQWFHHRDALLLLRSGAEARSSPTRVDLGDGRVADLWIDPADVLAARAAALDD